MALFYSSVACSEEWLSFSEDYNLLSGGTAQAGLRCAWLDRFDLINDLLGYPRTYPRDSSLVAVQAGSRPAEGTWSQDGQSCFPEQAIVTVQYSSNVVDIASESLEPFTEMGELDHRLFRWTSGLTGRPLVDGEQAPFIRRGLNIVRTRYRLSALPTETTTCLDCVNDIAYASAILGLTFDAETLLFQPQGMQRSFTTLGSSGWTMSLKFSFKQFGWNKFWNIETQSYESIYLAGSTTPYKPHTPASFSSLLS